MSNASFSRTGRHPRGRRARPPRCQSLALERHRRRPGEIVHRAPAPGGERVHVPGILPAAAAVATRRAAAPRRRAQPPRPVSFLDRDHGPRDGTPLLPWIRRLLRGRKHRRRRRDRAACVSADAGLRVQPGAFWVCHDANGGVRAVLCEVSNTFGETHHYLLAHPRGAPLSAGETLTARKVFHVSPFCAVRAATPSAFTSATAAGSRGSTISMPPALASRCSRRISPAARSPRSTGRGARRSCGVIAVHPRRRRPHPLAGAEVVVQARAVLSQTAPRRDATTR